MAHLTARPADLAEDEPRTVTRARLVTMAVALAHAALRLWWAATGSRPAVPPLGDDLLFVGDGGAGALCLAAVALAPLIGRPRRHPALRRLLTLSAWVVSAALLGASCLVILDLVGLLFPGVGIQVPVVGMLSRAAGWACGALLATTALLVGRVHRGACPRCGRWLHDRAEPDPHLLRTPVESAPRWAVAAAAITVLACVIRLGAQAVIGFEPLDAAQAGEPASGVARIGPVLFLACIVASGTVLPVALVHRWGRTVPRWMPVLAGRTVPRWLLLAPAFLVSAGMVTYFGSGVVQLLLDAVRGASTTTATAPQAFLWVAVPAYVVWGAGLGAAALSYWRRTRPACRRCGAT